MSIIDRLFHGVATHFERRLQEWGLATWMCVIGLIFLDTEDHFQSMPAYGLLRHLVNEKAWGWISLAIGTTWFVALCLNGSFRPFRMYSFWLRGAASILTATYCILTAIASFDSNPLGVNWADNVAFAILAVASTMLIGREIGRQA